MTINYDAWKTRSDLDDADRGKWPPEICADCGQTLGRLRWAQWSADDVMLFFCDDCADERQRLAGR